MRKTKKISAKGMAKKQVNCLDRFSVKKVGGDVYVEGWANKAIVDRGKDIIKMDAWELENYKKVPMILFNHDKDKPIGKAVDVRATDAGLWIKAKLSRSKDAEISRVRDLVEEGILNAFSVGFDAKDEQKGQDGVNEIKQAELYEVSIVTLPMNQDSVFSISSKDLASLSKTEAVSKVLSNKGAWVAAAVHDKIYQEQEAGKKRDELLQAIAASASTTMDELTQVLAGNVTPVPEQLLAAFAEVLAMDVEELKRLDAGDVEAMGAASEQPQEEPEGDEPPPPPEEDATEMGSKPQQEDEEQKDAAGKALEVGVIAILIPKGQADSPEAAAEMAQAAGFVADNIQATDQGFMVLQGDPSLYMEGHTSQLDLGNGVMAIIGVKKPEGMEEQPEAEPEEEMGIEEEEEKLEEPTDDTPTEDPEAQNGGEDIQALVEQFNSEVEATEGGGEGNPASWVADEALWDQAKRASQEAFGEIKYPFVVWWYMQHGGGKKGVAAPKQKQADGTPIPSSGDGTIVTDGNPYLEQAKQTNILLGVLIQEFRGLSAKLDSVAIQKVEDVHQEEIDQDEEVKIEPEEDELEKALLENIRNHTKDLETKLKKLGA